MYKSMPISYSIYDESSNPLLGDLVTHVELRDESAGPMIKLENPTDISGEIFLDLDELEEITRVAKKMVDQYNKQKEIK